MMQKKMTSLLAPALALLLCSTALHAEVVATYAFAVKSEAAMLAAIDKWFQSEDARGHSANLMAAEFSGSSPVTHIVVARFADYTAYETMIGRQAGSTAWRDLISSVEPVSSFLGSGLLVSVERVGEDSVDHDYETVFTLQVQDVAAYRRAFDRLAKSRTFQQAPGSTGLWAIRAAGADSPTHVVVMNARGFVEMHQYLDTFLASDDYAKFKEEVGAIRKIVGVSTYRRVGHWSK